MGAEQAAESSRRIGAVVNAVGGSDLVFKVAGSLPGSWGGSPKSGGAAENGGAFGRISARFGTANEGLLWSLGGSLWEFREDRGGSDVGRDGNALFNLLGG